MTPPATKYGPLHALAAGAVLVYAVLSNGLEAFWQQFLHGMNIQLDEKTILPMLGMQTLFFEKMFESRLYFVDRLRQMGAKIVQCDPHRVVVTGPSTLYGGAVSSNDIRAGISLVIAALCAKGETVIENAETIDRGYVAIERGLSALGADIRRA